MLYIYCEGQTEALFVSQILNPECLAPSGRTAIPIRADGLKPFERVWRDLTDLLRNPIARVTTLIDFYGMPADYPGMPHGKPVPGNRDHAYGEVARLERALGERVNSARFIPHYALHEFETLAFASGEAVDLQRRRIGPGSIRGEVERIVAAAGGNPELVNDSVATSPSRRLASLWPSGEFQKTIDSLGIVRRIPFVELRSWCRHFDAWVSVLESG
jgi:hypothetical protein